MGLGALPLSSGALRGRGGGAHGPPRRSRRAAAPREGTVEHRQPQSARLKPAGAPQLPSRPASEGDDARSTDSVPRPRRSPTPARQPQDAVSGGGRQGHGDRGLRTRSCSPPEVWGAPAPSEAAGVGACGEFRLVTLQGCPGGGSESRGRARQWGLGTLHLTEAGMAAAFRLKVPEGCALGKGRSPAARARGTSR